MAKGKQFLLGMKAGIPIVFGFIPVAIAFAISAREAGLSALETQFMSICVFAGASQMMAVEMWASLAGIAAIVLATFIVNLRHIMMSVCIMQRMPPASLPLKLLSGYGVTDEGFAVFTNIRRELCTMPFFLGLTLVSYGSWNVGTFIGAFGADLLPEIITLSFGIALYAMFIAIVTPSVTGNLRLLLLVLMTAFANWALSFVLDSGWAMIVASLLGAFVGVFFVTLDGEKTVENSENIDTGTAQGEEGAE